jgi:uncharacterized membrane protein
MWFIGLILGAIIGAIGGERGAVIGALVGAGAGWAIAEKLKASGTHRLAELESSLRVLQARVASLEEAIRSPAPVAARPREEVRKAEAPVVPPRAAAPANEAPPVLHVDSLKSAPPRAQPAPETVQSAQERTFPTQATRAPSQRQPSALWDFFFGGNTLVRFGVIVLFFGVAFLLKYASEHIEIPIEARLIGVALGAIVMLALGWRLRLRRPGYALIVQGGGVGLLYLTVFAAFRLYQLLPAGLVFSLLTAMAILSALLAVLQDSRSLAAMAVTGGFLAPPLASTGGGSHVMLFGFYALLNFAILIIAWFKAWRSLNLLGFAFTFVIGLVWGARFYRADLFASTEPFLILFFLFYVAIAVLFAVRQEASIRDRVDGTLVFGTPLVAFGLQTALVENIEYGAAYSAITLSFFYLLLGKVLLARGGANIRLLVEAFIALGAVFGTLAIPLALDARWTAAAWALEGAAIVWVGVRQEKIAARGFGIFLQLAAGLAFFIDAPGSPGALPVLNSFYLGCVLIGGSGLFSAWYLKRERARVSDLERTAAIQIFCWGAVWWFGGGFHETDAHLARGYRLHGALLFAAASCGAFSLLYRRIDWREAKYAALAILPLMYFIAVAEIDDVAHPLAHFGFVAWPLALAAYLWLLHRHEDTKNIDWLHAAGIWLAVAIAAWELAWRLADLIRGGDVWRLIGWPLVPVALLSWLTDRGERVAWPVARHHGAYLVLGSIPVATFIWLWMIHANLTSRGDPAPLPYLPLLNPLDLTQFAALMALFAWLRRIRREPLAPELFRSGEVTYAGLGCVGFLWLNGVLLRSLHHWAGVPFHFEAMMRSMTVQAAFSIFWSVLALCAMFAATRLRLRALWISGAVLMAAVVGKLFFVDLSNVGGVQRIVSFIGVGLLMLVIGYVSPVPPAAAEEKK